MDLISFEKVTSSFISTRATDETCDLVSNDKSVG